VHRLAGYGLVVRTRSLADGGLLAEIDMRLADFDKDLAGIDNGAG